MKSLVKLVNSKVFAIYGFWVISMVTTAILLSDSPYMTQVVGVQFALAFFSHYTLTQRDSKKRR